MEVNTEKLSLASRENACWELTTDEPIMSIRNGSLVVLLAGDVEERRTQIRYRINAIYDVATQMIEVTRCELRPGFVLIGGPKTDRLEQRLAAKQRASRATRSLLFCVARNAVDDRKLPA